VEKNTRKVAFSCTLRRQRHGEEKGLKKGERVEHHLNCSRSTLASSGQKKTGGGEKKNKVMGRAISLHNNGGGTRYYPHIMRTGWGEGKEWGVSYRDNLESVTSGRRKDPRGNAQRRPKLGGTRVKKQAHKILVTSRSDEP